MRSPPERHPRSSCFAEGAERRAQPWSICRGAIRSVLVLLVSRASLITSPMSSLLTRRRAIANAWKTWPPRTSAATPIPLRARGVAGEGINVVDHLHRIGTSCSSERDRAWRWPEGARVPRVPLPAPQRRRGRAAPWDYLIKGKSAASLREATVGLRCSPDLPVTGGDDRPC